MKLEKFNSYSINESLKSTIVKRLQKEPHKRQKYVNGEYVEATEYTRTIGFDRLLNYYDLEKLDDSYFTSITQDQAKKKPYNESYLVFCFKNGNLLGYFRGTDVSTQSVRYGRKRNENTFSRKSIIENSDELIAFDEKRADIEIKRNDVSKDRRNARIGTEAEYIGRNYGNYGNSPKDNFNNKFKKDNIDRYYKLKSKNLDFSDVYDMLQTKLKKAYKNLAHSIEDAKNHTEKNGYNLSWSKPDEDLINILKIISYEKSTNDVNNIINILRSFQDLMVDFTKLKEEGKDQYNGNVELIRKLKFIQNTLKKKEKEDE